MTNIKTQKIENMKDNKIIEEIRKFRKRFVSENTHGSLDCLIDGHEAEEWLRTSYASLLKQREEEVIEEIKEWVNNNTVRSVTFFNDNPHQLRYDQRQLAGSSLIEFLSSLKAKEKIKGKTFYENTVPNLKRLFRQELKACIPERKKPHTYSSENSEEYIKYCDAYNQALDEVEQNINKLLEEGVENA